MVIVDEVNFQKFIFAEINDDESLSLISSENKLKIIDYIAKNSNQNSKIEQLLLSIRNFKKGFLTSSFFNNFEI